MIHLLIDNCSLFELIDNHGYSKYFNELEDLINSKKLKFYTHALVLDEWKKHRYGFVERKERKLLGNGKELSTENKDKTSTNAGIIKLHHIQIQAEQIDKILSSSIILETPEQIKNEFADRYRDKLAPFHSKKNSQNDWYILGSFCHYCELNGIYELHFLSKNTGEFINNESSITEIHNDFKTRFQKVKIRYFVNLLDLVNSFTEIEKFPVDLIPFSKVACPHYSYKATIKKTVLDSLCNIYNNLYGEINFIPLHILTKFYPFTGIKNRSNAYYSNFSISEVSNDLVDFFDKLTISDNKIIIKDEKSLEEIKDYKSKIDFIVYKLNQNLVQHLYAENNSKRICVHIYRENNCDCTKCQYDSFKYYLSLHSLKDVGNDYKEKLKHAYVHYKFGNYISANYIYDEIAKKAYKESKFISYFIAKYNQKQLSRFCSNFFSNKEVDNDLVNKLKEIDPIEEAVKLKSHTDYNLLLFTCQEDYFSDAFQEISEVADKIISSFYSQLKGGWSSNSHVEEIMEHFAKLDSFLNDNYIIYDKYSNFTKLFDKVIEALLASHAITGSNVSRINEFNDYWILKIIEYGDMEKIIKHCRRYNLNTITYKSSNEVANTIFNYFDNLVASKFSIEKEYDNLIDSNNRYYKEKIEREIENSISILSLINFKKNELTKFASLIISYLQSHPKFRHTLIKTLEYFFEQKGILLNTKLKLQFIKLFIKREINCHNENMLSVIETLNKTEASQIPENIFNFFLNGLSKKCKKCNRLHSLDCCVHLFSIGNASQKKRIRDLINNQLVVNWSFDFFYLISIYGLVKPNKNTILDIVNKIVPKKYDKDNNIFFWGRNSFQNDYYNQLINLCFKYNIDTTDTRFKKIADYHFYYKWLLNMEAFNYKVFNPEWAMMYQTTYYIKAMSKSVKLKKALTAAIRYKYHAGIERVLMKITYFA